MDLEKLINNDVNKFVFADGIRELVRKGRGKNPNLIITGSSIHGKTLILNIFNTTSTHLLIHLLTSVLLCVLKTRT